MNFNPLQEFHERFCEARNHDKQQEVNATMLHTVSPNQQPHSRIVLLKTYDWDGFTFFTNYSSQKAVDINHNNKVTIFFNWSNIQTFITVTGEVVRTDEAVSDTYFSSRPRLSQLGAHASLQSAAVASRRALEKQFATIEEAFADQEIPRPENWGGFLIKPVKITFTDVKDDLVCTKTYRLDSHLDWNLTTTYSVK